MSSLTDFPTEVLLQIYCNLPFATVESLSNTSRRLKAVFNQHDGYIYKHTVTEIHDTLIKACQVSDQIQFAAYSQRTAQKVARDFVHAESKKSRFEDSQSQTKLHEHAVEQTYYQLWLCYLIYKDPGNMPPPKQRGLFDDDCFDPHLRLRTIYRMHQLLWYLDNNDKVLGRRGVDAKRIARLMLKRAQYKLQREVNRHWHKIFVMHGPNQGIGELAELEPFPFRDGWKSIWKSPIRPEHPRFLTVDEVEKRHRSIESRGMDSNQDPREAWKAGHSTGEYAFQ